MSGDLVWARREDRYISLSWRGVMFGCLAGVMLTACVVGEAAV